MKIKVLTKEEINKLRIKSYPYAIGEKEEIMKKYNLDKLVKVECNDFYLSFRYKYVKEKKFLGFVIQKEGIYETFWNDYIGLEVPENHILKDGVIYENPEVILRYQAGHSRVYYFNTLDEAKKFADEITAIGRWQF